MFSEQRAQYNSFNSRWQGKLTPVQYTVGLFLFEQCHHWEKRNGSYVLSYKQISEGIFDRAGNLIRVGVGLARRTIINAVNKLVELGVIERERSQFNGANRYRIKWDKDMAKTAPFGKKRDTSKARTAPKRNSQMVHQTTLGGAPKDTLQNSTNVEKPTNPTDVGKKTALTRNPVEALSDSLSAVIERGKAARAKRSADPDMMKRPDRFFADLWQPTIKAFWPEAPVEPWTGKQKGQFRNWMKAWDGEAADFPEFACWAIANWATVCGQMNISNPPLYPTLSFLYGARNSFMQRFTQQALFEARGQAANGIDAKRFYAALKSGMTPEAAAEKVKAENALAVRRRDVESAAGSMEQALENARMEGEARAARKARSSTKRDRTQTIWGDDDQW